MNVTNQKAPPRKAKSMSTLEKLVDTFTPKHVIDPTTAYTKADLKAHPGANPRHVRAFGERRFSGQRWRRVRDEARVTLFDLSRWMPHQGTQEAARRRRRMAA